MTILSSIPSFVCALCRALVRREHAAVVPKIQKGPAEQPVSLVALVVLLGLLLFAAQQSTKLIDGICGVAASQSFG
jgi:hypothetical protein